LFRDSDGGKTAETLQHELLNRFNTLLNVKSSDDHQKLTFYIKSIFRACGGEYNSVKQKLTGYFSDITVYKKEKKIKKKLKKVILTRLL
jgi:hypothetical protein